MEESKKVYVYIDAANIFYGGGKNALMWRVDYQAFVKYLRERHDADKVYFFGGVETYKFKHNLLKEETLPLEELCQYLTSLKDQTKECLKTVRLSLLEHPLQSLTTNIGRVKFYKKLKEFGYELSVKPIKTYYNGEDAPRKKRNCDVDMACQMLKDQEDVDKYIVLSGDGDFLPVLKTLKENGKEVLILARGVKTAKEIKQFAAHDFIEFDDLKSILEEEKESEEVQDDGR